MPLNLTILYRGPLASCNYECRYCPFAKRRDSAADLAADRAALDRFTAWAAARGDIRLSVFFTPWGEALVRRWYRSAIARLTRLPHVRRVAIQTNLSAPLDWLDDCDLARLGLWCTYHPSQVSRARFLRACRQLDRRGARYSVGMVGLREDFDEIEALRRALPPAVYLWINALKRQPDPYTEPEIRRLEAVDPHFRTNTVSHASLGRACRCGESVISVDGDGAIRRCHFIAQSLGNLYEPDFERRLADRPCTNRTCGCHIGYVHLDHLRLAPVYGDGILERIPAQPSWRDPLPLTDHEPFVELSLALEKDAPRA